MTISRRKLLGIIGGGTIVAAGAGTTGFVTTRTPHKALAPWDAAGGYKDPRKQALSYAILAPNPHNRQPWLVDLKTSDQVIVYRDKARDLPHTDPFSRQLTIGLGCFLELMVIAAAQYGQLVDLDLFPQGEEGPVAVATFKPGAQADPLFSHVMERRSCKEPFEDRQVPEHSVNQLSTIANVVTQDAEVQAVRKLTWDAWLVEAETPRTMKESVDLMRMGKTEINTNPDGIDLGGPFLESLMLMGMLSREAQLDPNSTSFKQGVSIYSEMLAATPAYVSIATNGNNRKDQIAAGRKWLRLNLMTTQLGLALHPVSQALQEYPEMKPLYDEAHKMLAKPGETVQMLGRLGFGPEVGRTPRWPMETKIL